MAGHVVTGGLCEPEMFAAGNVTTLTSPEDTDRAEFTAALRQLADYLDAHPDLPVPRWSEVAAPLSGFDGDEGKRAEVDRVAAVLGVQPAVLPAGHYDARRQFGSERHGVTYRATAITDARMDGYRAEATYYGAVQP